MDFSSFLTSLGTSLVIFLVLMCMFVWLSRKPGNNVVYYPNRTLKGLDAHEGLSGVRNPFAWMREALSSTEEDVISMSVVDSVVYFVFLSTEDILGAFERWSHRETLPAEAHKKVRLMCFYCKRHNEIEVPDPYYGGPQGFEKLRIGQFTSGPSYNVVANTHY